MIKSFKPIARLILAATAVLLSAACEHSPSAPGSLASITVTANSETLPIGTSRQFSATGYDADGNVVGIRPNWTATSGGSISADGVFTAGSVIGSFPSSVAATVGSISGRANVIVTHGPAVTVTLTPTPVTLATGGAQTFVAVFKDAGGNVVPSTPSWAVAAGGGTISAAGLFTAGTVAGTFTNTVTATLDGLTARATVLVTPGPTASITVTPSPVSIAAGATQQFTAVLRDASGNLVTATPTWSVSAGGGTINAAGVFTAGPLAGSFPNTVTASAGGVSGSATVHVVAAALASIVVTPDPVTLAIGATQQFTATARDAFGNTIPVTVNWAAVQGGTISSSGLFTAGTVAGTFAGTVTASVGGTAGSATVTVTPAVLASVTVTPNPRVLEIGETQQFTATGRDANGNIVAFTPVWSIRAGGGALDASGRFTAGTVAGTYANTIRACSTATCAAGSTAGFATVTVVAGALASITVSPSPIDVGTNAAQQFTAVGRDASGNIIPILPSPVWSVKPGHAGGTILSSGGYTAPPAVGVGFDSIRATSGAIVGAARVNVVPTSALVAIVVTPNPASVVAGGSVQFNATGFDAAGVIVPTPGLTWAVLAGGGSINATGQFTAGAVVGTFVNTVRATSGAISGRATVEVTAVPPVTPASILGAAATHGILAGSTVTCAGAPGLVQADVSVWPGTTTSGFPPCVITGGTHLGDPFAQIAQGDLTIAFLALAAMPCGTTITSDLGGTTLAPGVYCSNSSVGVTGTVTLNGPATAVFVIRAPSTLTTAGNVVLTGGALPENVYWWVGSSATLGIGSQWQGNILSLQSITLAGGVNLIGRALARNGAVSLNGTGNTIILP